MSANVPAVALYQALEDPQVAELERRVAARAKCRRPGADPEAWFPTGGESEHVSEAIGQNTAEYAREVCAGCPVIASCLKLSLEIPQGHWGVWGGRSARERRQMLRARHNAVLLRETAARRRVVEIAAAAEAAEQQTPATAAVAS